MTRAEDLVALVVKHRGVAHSSALRVKGFTSKEMSVAVDAGLLSRVRRSWLATPECDPRRLRAASLGGRVTCVTAAEMHELWVPAGHDSIHIAVSSNASKLEVSGCRMHWSNGPAAVARTTTEDHLLNVLFHVARCLSREDAAMVWESAIRKKKVQPATLPRVQWRSSAAYELASLASALSDSGLETRFVWIMRGCGVEVRQQVWLDGHPVDGLIGDRLVVQIDGFAHHQDAAARRRDIAADARLVLLGYTVLRFDYKQILFAPDEVREIVVQAMAQGLHLAAR